MINVGIIDSNINLVNNYKLFFTDFPHICISFNCNTYEEFLNKSDRFSIMNGVQLLIVDINIPGADGLSMISELRSKYPDTHVLVFTALVSEISVSESLSRGACGYVVKSVRMHELHTAICDVMQSGAYLSATAASQLIRLVKDRGEAKYDEILTQRERELIGYLQQGLSHKEIAKRMYLSVYTVSYHLRNIYPKMNVESKAQLISKMRRENSSRYVSNTTHFSR